MSRDSEEGLRRVLGPVESTAVVVGAIIGVGIFFTPARVAALTGTWELALTAWLIGCGVALVGALVFAELGAMLPRTGGQYVLLREAYGDGVGFVYVACTSTGIVAGAIAIIAWVCARNLLVIVSAAFGGEDAFGDSLVVAIACGLIALIAAINALGVKWGANLSTLTSASKLLTLAAIAGIAAGAYGLDALPDLQTSGVAASLADGGAKELTSAPSTELPVAARLAAALVPILFSFGGWQQVLWLGGEVKEPKRTLPIAIIAGVSLVIFAYLAANVAYFVLLGTAGVASSEALAADAVGAIFGSRGRSVVALAVAVSALGILNAQLLAGPRLLFALSRDGLLHPRLGVADERTGAPVNAVLVLASLALLLLLLAGMRGVDTLLSGVVLLDAIFLALTALSSWVLEPRYPARERPLRMPGARVLCLAFALAEFAVVIGAWLDPNVRVGAMVACLWALAAVSVFVVRRLAQGL